MLNFNPLFLFNVEIKKTFSMHNLSTLDAIVVAKVALKDFVVLAATKCGTFFT